MTRSASPLEIICSDQRATERLAEDIAAAIKPGDLITLSGDLGAGKTTFARALIRNAADAPSLEVPSPTFSLVQTYSDLPFGSLAHFDLYRLEAPEELDELGLYEALELGAALIEWADKGNITAEEITLDISIEIISDDARRFCFCGKNDAMARVERSLLIRNFLDQNGYKNAGRFHLTGDASARAYETIRPDDGVVEIILMNAPAQPDGPIIRDGKPYSQIAHLAENMNAFAGIATLLTKAGFRAPKIYAQNLDTGLLLIENLGTEGIIDGQQRPIEERYEESVALLAELHEIGWKRQIAVDESTTHVIPDYDHEAMMIEVDLLPSWYAEYKLDRALNETELNAFNSIWSNLINELSDSEKSLVLRDYHSPNIIWRDTAEGKDRIGLIDFQDAVIGPSSYDVASIVQDARIDIPKELESSLVAHYCACRKPPFDKQAFHQSLAIMQAQRATKILGIFVRLSKRDGKHGYLAHLPRIEDYVSRACAHPSLAQLDNWMKTVFPN